MVADAERLTALLNIARNFWDDGQLAVAVDIGTVERQAASAGSLPGCRYRHADDLALISHSSGTTNVPKPTAFTHRSFTIGKRERL